MFNQVVQEQCLETRIKNLFLDIIRLLIYIYIITAGI